MTLLLPDGTPYVSTAKAATGVGVGYWNTGTPLESIIRTPQALMKRAQLAYHVNPWIGLAEGVVTRKVVGLPWHLEDGEDEEYEEEAPPDVEQAKLLLERPQFLIGNPKPATASRRLMTALTSRHLGLCGMTHWFGDQIDTRGIPTAYLYINPARMWASEDGQGNLTGWVLDAQDSSGRGGTPLPLEQVLTFYLDPPDWGHYGTGIYERAVLKSQITNLADQHSAYVIGTGGRIAGIVSPKEGAIQDEKFQALVSEFRNVNEAPDAAKRTTILQGPVDFTPTAANPTELNLVELASMNRDDILAIWGVPPSQAAIPTPAGLNSGSTKGFDEAILMQGAVHDRVLAIKETLQYGFLDKYQPLVIELEFEETDFDDRTPSFNLLSSSISAPLTNAERRDLVGLPPFGDPAIDNAILLPSTAIIWATAPGEGETEGVIEGQEEGDDLGEDEIDLEGFLDEEPVEEKAGPRFIFGKKNPAYSGGASSTDVDKELADIEKRARAKGLKPSKEQIMATYKKNLIRKQKQAIAARAKKRGKPATDAQITATLKRNIARDPKLAALFKASTKQDLLGLRRAMDTRITPALRKSVSQALDAQRAEIVSKVRARGSHLQSKPTDQRIWWNEEKERDRLTAAIRPHLAGIAETVVKRTSEVMEPKPKKADFEDRVAQFVLKRGGERITDILRTTREKVQAAITQGFLDGLAPLELAHALETSTTFDLARADLIARTETALAYNDAALNSYTEFGVEQVEPIDGDEDPECVARLERGPVSIEEALADTDHPNGTLDWVPYFGKASTWQPALVVPQQEHRPEPVVVNVQPPVMPRPPMGLQVVRDEYGKITMFKEVPL